MASITNLDFRYLGRNISYTTNSGDITVDYDMWNQNISSSYKFIVTGSSSSGTNLNCAVYKNSVFQYNVDVVFIAVDFPDWTGSAIEVIDGIDIYVGTTVNTTVNEIEEFTLTRDSTATTETITFGDLWNGDDRVTRVDVIKNSTTYTVYHEQIPTPSLPAFQASTSSSIEWRYYVPSISILGPGATVNIVAKLSTSPYTTYRTIATNLSAGASFDYNWTTLPQGTHTTTYYLAPYQKDMINSSAITSAGVSIGSSSPSLSVYSSYGFLSTSNTLIDNTSYAYSTNDGTPYITYDFAVAKQIRTWTVKGYGREDREYIDENSSTVTVLDDPGTRWYLYGSNSPTSGFVQLGTYSSTSSGTRIWSGSSSTTTAYRYYRLTMPNYASDAYNIDYKRILYFGITSYV